MKNYLPKYFILKIVGLTFLIIFSITGMVISAVLFFARNDADISWIGLGFLLSAGITYVAIGKLGGINQAWKDAIKNALLEGKEEVLAHWTYQKQEWLDFAEKEVKRKRKAADIAFWVISLVVLIIAIISLVASDDVTAEAATMIGCGFLVVLGIVWHLIDRHYDQMSEHYLESTQFEVRIAKIALLVNRAVVIPLTTTSAHLKAVTVEEDARICFHVEQRGGDQNAVHKHYLPIPEGAEVDVLIEKLLDN